MVQNLGSGQNQILIPAELLTYKEIEQTCSSMYSLKIFPFPPHDTLFFFTETDELYVFSVENSFFFFTSVAELVELSSGSWLKRTKFWGHRKRENAISKLKKIYKYIQFFWIACISFFSKL